MWSSKSINTLICIISVCCWVCVFNWSYLNKHCDVLVFFFFLSPPERVVPFLSRPALPALLLPSGLHLFSSNAICRSVDYNASCLVFYECHCQVDSNVKTVNHCLCKGQFSQIMYFHLCQADGVGCFKICASVKF